MRRRKILVTGTVFLVLLGAIVWLFAGGGKGEKLKASVGFVGYTNAPDGTQVALFCVTNQSGVRLDVVWGQRVIKQNLTMPRFQCGQMDPISIKPGGICMLPLHPPSVDDAWSVRLTLANRGVRARIAETVFPDNDGLWLVVAGHLAPSEWSTTCESPLLPPPPAP